MKIIAALSVCLLVTATSIAQTASASKEANAAKKAARSGKGADAKVNKSVVYGSIRNMRNRPIKGVQAFVYKPDTSIIASGATDSAGHFETNGVVAGDYFVKLVYPSTKTVIISGIKLKSGSVELNLKADAPEADTAFTYDVVMPKPEPKKGAKAKK